MGRCGHFAGVVSDLFVFAGAVLSFAVSLFHHFTGVVGDLFGFAGAVSFFTSIV
ncbi:22673_t:CDS:1, partial [Gigaspora rosea]